jgi:HK97 family phage prohead protease
MLVHKTTHSESETGILDFVLSDATVDHFGDVIEPTGWNLENFKKNPIALFNHDASFAIGKWKNLTVHDGALRGRLKMAPAGSSPRIDEIRALIAAGILRAVSVGFRPIESVPRANSSGVQYLKQELLETSLCAVPANPSALLQAKALGVSKEMIKVIFKQQHGREATLAERIARSRRAVQKAKMILAKSEPKSPILLTMSEETAARYARSRAATAKARALLDRAPDQTQPDRAENTWRDEDLTLTWRGQKTPISKWKGDR